MSNISPYELIPMGKFLKPKGLKGEIRASIFNYRSLSLKVGIDIWLEKEDNNFFSSKIEKIQMTGEKSCIKLVDCNSREDAEALQGLRFFLPRDKFEPLAENEHYLVDLIGSKVVDEHQNSIGLVVDVLSMTAQNIIVVSDTGNEILIPYVDAHVKLFDKKKKIIIVKDVEGLIN